MEKKEWLEQFQNRLSFKDLTIIGYNNALSFLERNNHFEYCVKMELFMPLLFALEKFEKENFNLLRNPYGESNLDLIGRLKEAWGRNFKFYWRKIQLQEMQGRPIKQVDDCVDWSTVLSDEDVPSQRRDEFKNKKELLEVSQEYRETNRDQLYGDFKRLKNFRLNDYKKLAKMFVVHTKQWVEKRGEEFLPWMEEDREKYWKQAVVVAQEVAGGFANDLAKVEKMMVRDLGGKFEYYLKRHGQWVSIVFIVFFGVLSQLNEGDLPISKPVLSVLFVLGTFLIVFLRK